MSTHMQDWNAQVTDEKGAVIESFVVRGGSLRLALEGVCKMLASREGRHTLKATSITVEKVGREV